MAKVITTPEDSRAFRLWLATVCHIHMAAYESGMLFHEQLIQAEDLLLLTKIKLRDTNGNRHSLRKLLKRFAAAKNARTKNAKGHKRR